MPPLPPPGQPVLIRVATTQPHQTARQELRTALRQLLASWSRLSPERLPLCETAAGPVWPEPIGGHGLDISLSYADGEGWIGLIRGEWIGVDIMRMQHIPEAEEVARNYLEPAALVAIQQSTDPARTFAMAWTEREARLKCLKQPLSEWSVTQASTTARCATQNLMHSNGCILTVATKPSARNASGTSAPALI